jgi:hypothetical protein
MGGIMDWRQALSSKPLSVLFSKRSAWVIALATLLSFHIWLVVYSQTAANKASLQDFYLRNEILNEGRSSNEDQIYYSGSPEQDSILAKSPRKKDMDILAAREERFRSLSGFGLLALLLWPAGLITAGVVLVRRLWRAKDLPDVERLKRRQRLFVVGTITVSLALAILIISWRILSGQLREHFIYVLGYWAILAVSVITISVLLIELAWRLIAFGRLRHWLHSFPSSTKRIPQALAVAVVAFVAAGDVPRSSLFTSEASMVLLIAQVIGWFSIVFALGAAAMEYLKLPVSSTPPARISPLPTSSPSSASGSTASETGLSPQGLPFDKLNQLLALLESNGDRLGRVMKSNGRHVRPQDAVRNRSIETRERLITEVDSLTRRGNLNLTIGSVTSLVAATILWMLIAKAPTEIKSDTFLTYYAPRISVAIFIEVFSFFFLKLYKAGLADIKYYQNELTNLESRFLALELASLSSQSTDMPSLLRDLSSTDRNMILKAGDSTVDLERMKVEQQNLRSLVESILKIVPNIGSQPSSPPS